MQSFGTFGTIWTSADGTSNVATPPSSPQVSGSNSTLTSTASGSTFASLKSPAINNVKINYSKLFRKILNNFQLTWIWMSIPCMFWTAVLISLSSGITTLSTVSWIWLTTSRISLIIFLLPFNEWLIAIPMIMAENRVATFMLDINVFSLGKTIDICWDN